jgi:opacity protein-like surface antigen
MKTKTLGFLTTAAIMLTAGAANANLLFDVYAGGTFGIGGYTLFADKNESFSSTTYGAVLGMDIPMFRIELEYNYLDSDDATLNMGFVNGYFKLPTPVVKPYIGAGIGTTFSSEFTPVAHTTIDIDDTMVYQGMLGVTLEIPVVPFNIDVEGRVIYASDLIEYMNDTADVLQYEGRVKLRYVF